MNKVEKKDFDLYLSEARSWETVRVHELEKSRPVYRAFQGCPSGRLPHQSFVYPLKEYFSHKIRCRGEVYDDSVEQLRKR